MNKKPLNPGFMPSIPVSTPRKLSYGFSPLWNLKVSTPKVMAFDITSLRVIDCTKKSVQNLNSLHPEQIKRKKLFLQRPYRLFRLTTLFSIFFPNVPLSLMLRQRIFLAFLINIYGFSNRLIGKSTRLRIRYWRIRELYLGYYNNPSHQDVTSWFLFFMETSKSKLYSLP